MRIARNTILFFLLPIALIAGIFFSHKKATTPALSTAYLSIHEKQLQVEVADTDMSREHGLSDRNNLGDDRGMIFLFSQKGNYGFWMKDMRFPLDLVWIDDLKVVGLVSDAAPEGSAPKNVYYPPHPVDTVLELKAGGIEKYNFTVGDTVMLDHQCGNSPLCKK